MKRHNSNFKQIDLTRAIRGSEKGGMRVGRVEIGRDGRIIVTAQEVALQTEANDWDEVFDNGESLAA